jgi:G:T-mismatch repair DNA endonuclease (very short patch repair protein)
LRELGWTVATIWECETRNQARLDGFLAALFDRSNDIRTDEL